MPYEVCGLGLAGGVGDLGLLQKRLPEQVTFKVDFKK